MANRRKLKKCIKSVTGNLFADSVALSMCNGADKEALDGIMRDIVTLHTEYVSRISHTEKDSERAYYKKLRSEFSEKANALTERIVKA